MPVQPKIDLISQFDCKNLMFLLRAFDWCGHRFALIDGHFNVQATAVKIENLFGLANQYFIVIKTAGCLTSAPVEIYAIPFEDIDLHHQPEPKPIAPPDYGTREENFP